jgi:hypothetical protein
MSFHLKHWHIHPKMQTLPVLPRPEQQKSPSMKMGDTTTTAMTTMVATHEI